MSSLVFPDLPGKFITVARTPGYATGVQATASGKEFRAAWQTRPRTRWVISYEFLRADPTTADALQEWQRLVGFFNRHWGQFDSFLYPDPEDASVTAHPFGTGDGTTVAFQLQRTMVPATYRSSPLVFWPTITDGFEPITNTNSAPLIYVDGVLKTITTDYTINGAGLVTFVSAPANTKPLTWTGTYYKKVRFATDQLETRRIVTQIWESRTVELVQVI